MVESGDDITPTLDQRTLVLVNHQSTADVPMLMATFNTKGDVLPNIMWIMDKVFMYTNFGIVSMIHQDFFIGSVSLFFKIDFIFHCICVKITSFVIFFMKSGHSDKKNDFKVIFS